MTECSRRWCAPGQQRRTYVGYPGENLPRAQGVKHDMVGNLIPEENVLADLDQRLPKRVPGAGQRVGLRRRVSIPRRRLEKADIQIAENLQVFS
jgi:hypothetical protein